MIKRLKVTQKGIFVYDPEVKKRIEKANLSPSFVGSWLDSPADAILSRYFEDDYLIEKPVYLERGSWYHSIMEETFKIPAEERVPKDLLLSANKVTKENKEYQKLGMIPEQKTWLSNALKGYISMPEDQNFFKREVAEIFPQGQGIELFVNGKIGNAERNVVGFIDLLVKGDEGMVVVDWKTGKCYPYNPNEPISWRNSFDYWRQQITYTMLLEQKGLPVEAGCLVFPADRTPQTVWVDIFSPDARQKTIEDYETADREIKTAIDSDHFYPFRETKWNNWGSYLIGNGDATPPNIRREDFMKDADLSEVNPIPW